MKRNLLIVLILYLTQIAFASPKLSMKYQDIKVDLVGKGKLTYIFWDVYLIAYYKNGENSLITLNYLRDIDKETTTKGWKEGLKEFDGLSKQLEWLKTVTVDLKENDNLEIWKVNKKVIFILNKKLLGESADPDLFKYIHYPWIGKNSIDEDLKEKLLGEED